MPDPRTRFFFHNTLTKIAIALCAVATVVLLARGSSETSVLREQVSRSTGRDRSGTPPNGGELSMLKGLGTVIYPVSELNRAKVWYAKAFGQDPYFDEPFYVGFNIAGYELGLDPDPGASKPGAGGGVAYWRVDDIEAAVRHFVSNGA